MHEVTIHNCRGLVSADTHIADVAQRSCDDRSSSCRPTTTQQSHFWSPHPYAMTWSLLDEKQGAGNGLILRTRLHFPILTEGPGIALGVTAYIIGLTMSENPGPFTEPKGHQCQECSESQDWQLQKHFGQLDVMVEISVEPLHSPCSIIGYDRKLWWRRVRMQVYARQTSFSPTSNSGARFDLVNCRIWCRDSRGFSLEAIKALSIRITSASRAHQP